MTTKKILLASALLFAGVAAVTLPAMVQARGTGDGMDAGGAGMMLKFDEVDADKDGKVTEAEITAFRAAQVAGADANADGQISLEELTAHSAAMMQQMAVEHATRRMKAQDANGDGQLSVEEMLAPPARMGAFAKMDTDGDGAVSKEEMTAAQAQMAGRMDGRGRGHGRGHGGGFFDGGMFGGRADQPSE